MSRIARPAAGGFTLIELIVVIAIIALASGVLTLALRNPADTQLEREAARLSALLEAARTEARSLGATVVWLPLGPPAVGGAGGAASGEAAAQFRFEGLPDQNDLPNRWLDPATTAEIPQGKSIVLGPEPLIGTQRIVLRLEQRSIVLDTDGLGPFIVRGQDEANRPAASL